MYHLPFYIVLNTSCLPFKILHQSCFHYLGITPGVYMCVGGGGVLTKVLYREAPPRGTTPYPYYILHVLLTEKVSLVSHALFRTFHPFNSCFLHSPNI